jgi:hypothetical protein
MAIYFLRGSGPFYSITGVDYRIINIYRCPGCNLRNLDLRHRSPPPSGAEIIAIGDDTPERLLLLA